MNRDSQKSKAIDFLALVRQDLEEIGSFDTPRSAVITTRFASSDFDTVSMFTDDDAPSYLGRFKILEQVGEGGFARVFVANDPNLDREVALKVPKPHVLISPEARSRFEREAKSAAILSHPNIVPVFEIGAAGPIHFIASEYCPGRNLRLWYAESEVKPDPRTAVKIISQLADALQHAHRRGIVHRDLKPSNVLVVEGEEEIASRLRITDFGLARHIASEDSLTANGSIIGTPAYMSPEQAEGIGKVDHRTDVYSLGMVLYELLTGKAPFKRSSHIASIAAVVNEVVPAPSDINRKVDADLEAVCLRALEKDPDARYQSAHELKRDLNRWLNGQPVSVRKVSAPALVRKWVCRNPLVASAILFGVLSLSIGCAFSFVQWKQAQSNLAESIKHRSRAEKNVDELHDTIINALDISLDSLEKQVQLIPAQQDVLDELMSAHMRLIEEEAEQVEITPRTFECYDRLATIYRGTARYDKAIDIAQRAERMLLPCLDTKEGKEKFLLSAVNLYVCMAVNYEFQGGKEKQLASLVSAEKYHQAAEEFCDRLAWLEEGYNAFREMAFYHLAEYQYPEALKYYDLSGDMASEALGLDPQDEQLQFNYAKSFVDISHVYSYQRDWATCLECLETSERLFDKAIENPENEIDSRTYRYRLAYIRNEMSMCLRYALNDYDRAEEYSLWVVETLKQLTDENPGYLVYQNRLSQAYERLLEVYRVQDMFDEVLELIPAAIEAHSKGREPWAMIRTANAERLQARIYAFQYDEPELAREAFDRAIGIVKDHESFGIDNEHLVNSLLESYRHKRRFCELHGDTEQVIDLAGKAHHLAVQRALIYPANRNLSVAVDHARFYADRLSINGKYGLAKSALESLSDAGKDSARTQYYVADTWAKLDFLQREEGADKSAWEACQAKAMYHLTRAIDLGFDDYGRVRKRSHLRKYRHHPEFEANCERIKSAASSSK